MVAITFSVKAGMAILVLESRWFDTTNMACIVKSILAGRGRLFYIFQTFRKLA